MCLSILTASLAFASVTARAANDLPPPLSSATSVQELTTSCLLPDTSAGRACTGFFVGSIAVYLFMEKVGIVSCIGTTVSPRQFGTPDVIQAFNDLAFKELALDAIDNGHRGSEQPTGMVIEAIRHVQGCR